MELIETLFTALMTKVRSGKYSVDDLAVVWDLVLAEMLKVVQIDKEAAQDVAMKVMGLLHETAKEAAQNIPELSPGTVNVKATKTMTEFITKCHELAQLVAEEHGLAPKTDTDTLLMSG